MRSLNFMFKLLKKKNEMAGVVTQVEVNVVVDLDVEVGVPGGEGGGEEEAGLFGEAVVALDVVEAEEVSVLCLLGVDAPVQHTSRGGAVADDEADHHPFLPLRLLQLLPLRHPRLPHRLPPPPAAERRVDPHHHECSAPASAAAAVRPRHLHLQRGHAPVQRSDRFARLHHFLDNISSPAFILSQFLNNHNRLLLVL